MSVALTEREVNELLKLLNSKQKEFIEKHIKQNKISKWIEILAEKKTAFLEDIDDIRNEINEWELIDVLDGGYGNKPFKCECGQPLRYQYIVYHKTEGKTYQLGETCFERYTNLSPEILQDIKKGFYNVDLERDEILLKYISGDFFNIKPYHHLSQIPEWYKEQVQLELPLSDRQIRFLTKLKDKEEWENKLKQVKENLSQDQIMYLDFLSPSDKNELVNLLLEGKNHQIVLPEGFSDFEVEIHLKLNFPLLTRHKRKIADFNYQVQIAKEAEQRYNAQLFRQHQKESLQKTKTVSSEDVDYQTIMDRHADTLEKVKDIEHKIPQGLLKDWKIIQNLLVNSHKGANVDYSRFKLLLNNLLIPLRIEKDTYL